MMLANSLLDTAGRRPDSFVTFDVMRLPLGVLTGIGFIGAGAIFRNDALVVGVTTAATLWLATMIGLCLGAGAVYLGGVGCVLGIAILTISKQMEGALAKDRVATLDVSGNEHLSAAAVREVLASSGAKVSSSAIVLDKKRNVTQLRFEIERRESGDYAEAPPFVQLVAELPNVSSLRWKAMMLPA